MDSPSPSAGHTPSPGSQCHKERQWMVQGLSASRPGFYQNDSKGPRGPVCAGGQLATWPGSPRITWKQSTCKSIGLCPVSTFFLFLGNSFSRLILLLSGTGVRNHLLGESSPSFCVSSVMRIKQPLSTGSPQFMRDAGLSGLWT